MEYMTRPGEYPYCIKPEDFYKLKASDDMYEALKLYQKHQEGTSGHYCWQCANGINQALAKAEGESL